MAENTSQLSDSEYIKLMSHRLNHLRFVKPLPLVFFDNEELPPPSHRHSYYELRLLAKNADSDFVRLEIAAPGVKHYAAPMGFYRGCRIITVSTRGEVKSFRGGNDGKTLCYVSDSPAGSFLIRQIEMFRQIEKYPLPMDLQEEMFGTLLSLLIMAFRSFKRCETPFRSDNNAGKVALDYIFVNYANPDLSVQDVSAAAGVSPTYLPQLFRQLFGMTVRQMIVQVRLRRACELLAFGEHSIHEIALLCGWNDHSFFSNTFRKYYNMTPVQYAKNHYHGDSRSSSKFRNQLDELHSLYVAYEQ
ncbi:MAG: helix-turn-helix domain-containing protein [Lentisphaerae bacterium]|nr:helix-turn-helix domain-containing protein [Lentisphaerota bacterium]